MLQELESLGLTVSVFRGSDGMVVVVIDTTELPEEDNTELGEPNIRVWVNDTIIMVGETVGDDLDLP